MAGALIWTLLADFESVHVYWGEHPPRAAAVPAAPVVALVLGGGGPRGFAHIGVLKVLEAEGIQPDLIVGSSMGAIVGTAYARHGSTATIEAKLMAMDMPWWRDLTLVRRPLIKGDLLHGHLNDLFLGSRLEDMPLRIFAVVTRADTGEPVALSRGDAATAVRASAAVPGLFKRVSFGGIEYIDGDISAPVPVSLAKAAGACIVVAVDVMSHPADMPYEMRDYPDLALGDFYRHAINRHELAQADAVIQPELGYYISTSREDRERAMQAGEQAARKALPAIQLAMSRTQCLSAIAPAVTQPETGPLKERTK